MLFRSNLANGGVGVSFSNVVLGGGLNPNDPSHLMQPKSSYQQHFDDIKMRNYARGAPPSYDHISHKSRFIGGPPTLSTEKPQNTLAYVKGSDFNPA